MTELHKIRAEIVARRDAAATESRVADQNHALAIAELAAHDRAVAAMGEGPETPAVPTRRSIQGPVMALFDESPGGCTAGYIVMRTGLPEAAVRKFLSRAYKSGLLSLNDGVVYGLPTKPQSEAAQ